MCNKLQETLFYPDIQCDGLSLFEAQVQFGSSIYRLRIFADFILLFHPPYRMMKELNENVHKTKYQR